eukprot:232800_1
MAQEKVKTWFDSAKQKFDYRITMDGILKQARKSFEYFLESGAVDFEKKISEKLLRDAYGIVLLTEVKAGVIAGGKVGTGIIIVRIEDKEDEWSGPIAIGTGGFSFGLQGGASKVDHIILLPSPNHVKTFLGKGQLQIKGNAQAAIAQYGRDANVGIGVNDTGNAAPIISYSYGVKGLYGGVSIDGGVLVARKKCNKEFYGRDIDLNKIYSGEIEPPLLNADYSRIIQLLNNSLNIYTSAVNDDKEYVQVNQVKKSVEPQTNAYDEFNNKK